jgi:hypothetical protein
MTTAQVEFVRDRSFPIVEAMMMPPMRNTSTNSKRVSWDPGRRVSKRIVSRRTK